MPTLATPTSRKTARALLVLAGVVVYALACVGLSQTTGRLDTTVLVSLLGLWGAGLAVLLLPSWSRNPFAESTFTLIKCLWANLGVVVSAAFAPQHLRPLFLVVPLLVILHAALHLSRQHVLILTLMTGAAYLVLHPLLNSDIKLLASPELFVTLSFAIMLGLMYVVASEVAALRLAFRRRTSRLNNALRKLSDLAMRDDLTGVYNRRYVMDVLARQKALADRGHVGFTLCYCDLDHFKQINDRFGHPQGDRVLQAFARSAEEVVRSVDFVARFGGEEFLLVLVDADTDAAQHVAERLAERAKALEVPAHAGDRPLTVSVGIACFRPGESVESVIQRADRALYRAKSSGRDQIVQG